MTRFPPVDVDAAELARVTFRQVAGPRETWEMLAPDGNPFASAEIFRGEEQWGVRLQDRAPGLSEAELMRLVARLLVWSVGCKAETIDVVLGRNHEHQTLVRVGGDYV